MDRPRVDYDQLAGAYDARYSVEPLSGITGALLDLMRRHGCARVLEVGCGTGHWLAELAPHAHLVCGVDPALGMLRQAARKFDALPLVAAPANALPFTAGSFDLIFSVNAVHHFADAAAFIADASRLLTSRGVLAIVGIDPRLIRHRYFYEYFEGTCEIDRRRYPAVGDVVNWMAAAGFERIDYRIVDRYERVFRGREVLADPFLRKDSNSLLALLSDNEYRQGIDRIDAAIAAAEGQGSEAEFLYYLDFQMIAGWRRRSETPRP
jgi:SAM-dependent methyltransferase